MLDGDLHQLTIVNAGHMGPMVRRADGQIEVIGEDRSGLVLGVIQGQQYEATTITIGPRDVVVLYTDGVTEAESPDGKRFGIERLKRTLEDAQAGSERVGESILAAVRRHSAGLDQSDDITLLCFGRP